MIVSTEFFVFSATLDKNPNNILPPPPPSSSSTEGGRTFGDFLVDSGVTTDAAVGVAVTVAGCSVGRVATGDDGAIVCCVVAAEMRLLLEQKIGVGAWSRFKISSKQQG